MPVIIILIGFSICALTVARFAMISENHAQILALHKQLDKQQKRKAELKLELTTRGDLKTIEEFARNNLEMNYPDREQVLFVKLPEHHREEYTETLNGQAEKDSLWDRIISFLD